MHPWRTVGRAIPWSGCAPAEPASVSPGAGEVPRESERRKAKERPGGREGVVAKVVVNVESLRQAGTISEGRQRASGVPRLTVGLVTVGVH